MHLVPLLILNLSEEAVADNGTSTALTSFICGAGSILAAA